MDRLRGDAGYLSVLIPANGALIQEAAFGYFNVYNRLARPLFVRMFVDEVEE